MGTKKIRVLVVDDSMFVRKFISTELSKDSGIEVVGTASDPFDAKDKIIALNPEVMTLDVEMPRMNGIEFLNRLMPQHPLPVVVVSSVSTKVFDAMQAGAVDFVCKASLEDENARKSFISELIVKIKVASIAKVGQHKNKVFKISDSKKENCDSCSIIALGASTGGTEATAAILMELKNNLPGIVIVQHMPPVFTKLYADRLNNTCSMEVKEATDGDLILPGRALIAPGEYHMQVEKYADGFRVRCNKGEKVSGHCPSVDVLFDSVAKAAGSKALGIILTGMGSDGAKGLLSMRQKGAVTIGQNKESCIVYGMPMVANDIGAVMHELPLADIAARINQWSISKQKT